MSRKQHTRQFKLDAVNYHKEHPDLTQVKCASDEEKEIALPFQCTKI